MEDEEKTLRVVHGHVKWFDPTKGFGFIVSEECESDILLHANVLRNYGQSSVADGAGIVVHIQPTQRGAQAIEIVSIELTQPAALPTSDDGPVLTPDEIAACPIEPARVKWFDKSKGFGFANVFGRPEDVFIHIEVLRVSGFSDLGAGEAIGLRILQGKRGRMAVHVVAWEAAMRKAP